MVLLVVTGTALWVSVIGFAVVLCRAAARADKADTAAVSARGLRS